MLGSLWINEKPDLQGADQVGLLIKIQSSGFYRCAAHRQARLALRECQVLLHGREIRSDVVRETH